MKSFPPGPEPWFPAHTAYSHLYTRLASVYTDGLCAHGWPDHLVSDADLGQGPGSGPDKTSFPTDPCPPWLFPQASSP